MAAPSALSVAESLRRAATYRPINRKAERIFSLPMYPHLHDEEVDIVIDALRDVI